MPYQTLMEIRNPVSSADTLKMFVPNDADEREKDDFINSMPLVAELRADPNLIESRPHLRLPTAWREQNLTAGTLMGPGKVTVPPYTWTRKDGMQFVQISHVGSDMCGHIGIIHGGFLATMLDEGMGRCCFPVLPHNIGMTGRLEVSYKAPAMANQYLVLRAHVTKVEGRKCWVEAHIETVPSKAGEEPKILATGTSLYISPRHAAVRAMLHALVFSCGAEECVKEVGTVANVCDSAVDGEGIPDNGLETSVQRTKAGWHGKAVFTASYDQLVVFVVMAMAAALVAVFAMLCSVVARSIGTR